MNCFIEDDLILQRIKEVKEFAEKKENFYVINISDWIPGDRDEYVMTSGTIRTVYSITKLEDSYYRQISISNLTEYPNPLVVWYICDLYGFVRRGSAKSSGRDDSWKVVINEIERSIHVIQEIELDTAIILRGYPIFRTVLMKKLHRIHGV